MDIGSLLVNIAGNLMMHLLEIIGDLISLMTAVFSMNFFNIGKNYKFTLISKLKSMSI